MVRIVDESGNSILQAALVIPVALFVFLGVLQIGSVMAQVASLNSGIESTISGCDFSAISSSTDKNVALANQIGQSALITPSTNISASGTNVVTETQSSTTLASRDADQIYTVDQTVTKAHLTSDLSYDVLLFVNVLGTDSIRLSRHIDAWQTVENNVRFSEE